MLDVSFELEENPHTSALCHLKPLYGWLSHLFSDSDGNMPTEMPPASREDPICCNMDQLCAEQIKRITATYSDSELFVFVFI